MAKSSGNWKRNLGIIKTYMISVHLQQKKKGGQVVKINKEFRISQKRPRASQSSNSNKSNCYGTWMWLPHRQTPPASRWRDCLKWPRLFSCSWAWAGEQVDSWPPSQCWPRCEPGRPHRHLGRRRLGRAGRRWAAGPGSSSAPAWWCWEVSMALRGFCTQEDYEHQCVCCFSAILSTSQYSGILSNQQYSKVSTVQYPKVHKAQQ